MATFTTAEQAAIQSAIDLYLKGTANETVAITDDVIERLLPLLPFASTGELYEAVKDRPYTVLISLVEAGGSSVLTPSEMASLDSAIGLMELGTAYERPLADDVIARLRPVAASSGFATSGAFTENLRDRPVSTLLQFALYLGKK